MRANNRVLLQWKPSNWIAYLKRGMHRHSLILTHPLSLCLKLKELVGKIEPKHLRHPNRASYLPIAELKLSTENHRLASPQEDYDSQVLAEAPTNPLLIEEHRYPSLRALKKDEDIGDGLWLCCHCRHENILRHYKGRFPFKDLTCDRCDCMLCSECQTTEILSPLPYGMIHARRPSSNGEVRYLHVCTTCGLSHRAEMAGTTLDFYGVTCAGCGTSSYGDWPRYHIESVEPYKRDPDASYVRLVEQKAERAANLAYHWNDNRAPSKLSCKNPD